MQPSTRQQELERLYNTRKGHAPQISISDDQHHVTEAIGSYYDTPSEHEPPSMSVQAESRPLSFIAAPSEARFTATPRTPSLSKRHGTAFDVTSTTPTPARRTSALGKRKSSDRINGTSQGSEGNGSPTSPRRMSSLSFEDVNNASPSLSRHSSTDTARQHFPLNDIDYESSPAAVAQELSNLQAIRRMSMNVDTADPDLPAFGSGPSVPTIAPGHATSEDDPSKLFWVPARLHPELAPKEFKTFVEERVEKIRRRSASEDSLSPDSLERSTSGDGLRRKKSMLSHQIDPKGSYEDGAERLERRRSKGIQVEGQTKIANLHELEELVNDPTELVRRMSLDTQQRRSEDSLPGDASTAEDMPILPPVQATLKRSTHTTYRRGSLRRGERVPFSKRALNRQADQERDQAEPGRDITPTEAPMQGISRIRTEPMPESSNAETFGARKSSINRKRYIHPSSSMEDMNRSQTTAIPESELTHHQQHYDQTQYHDQHYQQQQPSQPHYQESIQQPQQLVYEPLQQLQDQVQQQQDFEQRHASTPAQEPVQPRKFTSRIASQGRTTAQLPGYDNTDPLPNILETLPDGTKVAVGPLAAQAQHQFPERKSSFDLPRAMQRGPARGRPSTDRQPGTTSSLDDLSSNPAMLPGGGATRTDALTMVPTFEEKKIEKKDGGRKSSWKWILGSDDDDKKNKDARKFGFAASDDTSSIKSGKSSKLSKNEKTRLDLLQSSVDTTVEPRPRESLVLNREDIKIDDDRKGYGKKSSDSSRKEKDSKDTGLLSAIFGGKKKTTDPELKEKKRKNERVVSAEPVLRILKPDIDYNWTRFSILEERAIYRMAHIKLANPRRALYSQVLLSNFMYSYLAKVQMMHPQMQIPAAQQQKMQQEQQRQQKAKEAAEQREYQQYQEQSRQDQPVQAAGQPGYESQSRSSYEQHADYSSREQQASGQHSEWPDYRSASNAQGQHDGGGGSNAYSVNGAGREDSYSVASTHEYMGYGKGQQRQQQQPSSNQDHLWDDEEHEDLW